MHTDDEIIIQQMILYLKLNNLSPDFKNVEILLNSVLNHLYETNFVILYNEFKEISEKIENKMKTLKGRKLWEGYLTLTSKKLFN